MGKPKVMASIRALHQTVCNLRPTSAGSSRPRNTSSCLCVQQSHIHSFRFSAENIYKSFNSIYRDSCNITEKEDDHEKEEEEKEETEELQEEEKEERERLLLLPLPTRDSSFDSSADPCSSSADSSSDSVLDSLLHGLSSKRFFFSPCTTKSILEEAKKDDGGRWTLELRREEDLEFCKESITLSMNSDDPYWDFRASMEEMVEAHGLRDWSCLSALLQCYLKLNDKKTHKIIVCAFIDLIMSLLDDIKE